MGERASSDLGPDRPVFISFAGAASRPQANALHDSLTAARIPAFLDSQDLAPGDRISPRLLEAVLAARVVVLLLDPTYFTRPYCREELDAALGLYDELLRRGAPAAELEEALLPVVVAWRVSEGMTDELKLLPPAMRDTFWPKADAREDVVRLVQQRLTRVGRPIGQRLDGLGALTGLRDRLLATIDTPPPMHLGSVRAVCARPDGLPESLGGDYVGRSDALWTLHRALAASPGRAEPAIALEGVGGAGKTQLAAEYLWRYGPATYPGGLVWIDADVPDRLEAQLHAVLRTLRSDVPGLAGFRAAGRDVRDELTRALRETASRGRVLYVVDDIPEAEREAQPLRHWCPAQGEVALVVTSRGRTTVGSGVVAIAVRELPPERAAALLRHEVGAGDAFGAAGWEEIARWVDGLPLALRVLNAALRARAVSPDELLTQSRQGGPARGVDRLRRTLPGAHVRGVEEAFAMSYGLLPGPTRRAARLIACLAPSPIPIALVARLLGPEDRAVLSSRSFASPVAGSPVDLYGRMHPVLADHLRSLTEDRHELLAEICAAALTIMTRTAGGDPAAWPLLDACRPHAATAFDQWRGLAPRKGGEASVPFVLLGLIIGDLIRRQGRPAEAGAWAERCLELANEALGPDHPRTLEATGSLAAALFDQGDLARPAALQELVLDTRTRLLGEEHPDTLRAKANLASTVHAMGHLHDALRMGQEVLAARVRSLGEEHSDTLWSKAAVARTLHALGRLDDAMGLARQLLDARRRVLGDAHPDTVEAMEILAAILRDRGELVPALQLGEGALEMRVRLLGGAHPDTLTALRGVAATLGALGASDGAIARWRRILAASPERS